MLEYFDKSQVISSYKNQYLTVAMVVDLMLSVLGQYCFATCVHIRNE